MLYGLIGAIDSLEEQVEEIAESPLVSIDLSLHKEVLQNAKQLSDVIKEFYVNNSAKTVKSLDDVLSLLNFLVSTIGFLAYFETCNVQEFIYAYNHEELDLKQHFTLLKLHNSLLELVKSCKEMKATLWSVLKQTNFAFCDITREQKILATDYKVKEIANLIVTLLVSLDKSYKELNESVGNIKQYRDDVLARYAKPGEFLVNICTVRNPISAISEGDCAGDALCIVNSESSVLDIYSSTSLERQLAYMHDQLNWTMTEVINIELSINNPYASAHTISLISSGIVPDSNSGMVDGIETKIALKTLELGSVSKTNACMLSISGEENHSIAITNEGNRSNATFLVYLRDINHGVFRITTLSNFAKYLQVIFADYNVNAAFLQIPLPKNTADLIKENLFKSKFGFLGHVFDCPPEIEDDVSAFRSEIEKFQGQMPTLDEYRVLYYTFLSFNISDDYENTEQIAFLSSIVAQGCPPSVQNEVVAQAANIMAKICNLRYLADTNDLLSLCQRYNDFVKQFPYFSQQYIKQIYPQLPIDMTLPDGLHSIDLELIRERDYTQLSMICNELSAYISLYYLTPKYVQQVRNCKMKVITSANRNELRQRLAFS